MPGTADGRVEVEAQPARRVERARLGRRFAERAAERAVHQMRRGVRTRDGGPARRIDLGVDERAGSQLAVEHPRAVHDQPGDRRLHVEHLGGAAVEDEPAVVALLAAGLGVERRDVDDDADLVAGDGRRQQRRRAEVDQRRDGRLAAQLLVAGEDGRAAARAPAGRPTGPRCRCRCSARSRLGRLALALHQRGGSSASSIVRPASAASSRVRS